MNADDSFVRNTIKSAILRDQEIRNIKKGRHVA